VRCWKGRYGSGYVYQVNSLWSSLCVSWNIYKVGYSCPKRVRAYHKCNVKVKWSSLWSLEIGWMLGKIFDFSIALTYSHFAFRIRLLLPAGYKSVPGHLSSVPSLNYILINSIFWILLFYLVWKIFYFLCVALEFELSAFHLVGRCSTAWIRPPGLLQFNWNV
jgi:hypothetical protein